MFSKNLIQGYIYYQIRDKKGKKIRDFKKGKGKKREKEKKGKKREKVGKNGKREKKREKRKQRKRGKKMVTPLQSPPTLIFQMKQKKGEEILAFEIVDVGKNQHLGII